MFILQNCKFVTFSLFLVTCQRNKNKQSIHFKCSRNLIVHPNRQIQVLIWEWHKHSLLLILVKNIFHGKTSRIYWKMQTKVCNALLLILYLCVVESCFVFIRCFICFICVLTKTAFKKNRVIHKFTCF